MYFHAHTNGLIILTNVLLKSQGSKECFVFAFLCHPLSWIAQNLIFNTSPVLLKLEMVDLCVSMPFGLWRNSSVLLDIISYSKFFLHFDRICFMKFQVIVLCY